MIHRDVDPRDLPVRANDSKALLEGVNRAMRVHILRRVLEAWIRFEESGRRVEIPSANGVAVDAWLAMKDDVVTNLTVKEIIGSPQFSSPSFAIEPVVRRLIAYREECERARLFSETLDGPLGLLSPYDGENNAE